MLQTLADVRSTEPLSKRQYATNIDSSAVRSARVRDWPPPLGIRKASELVPAFGTLATSFGTCSVPV